MTGSIISTISDPLKKKEHSRKYKRLIVVIVIIMILILINVLDYIYYHDRFYPGIFIGNTYIGNKRYNEVRSLLEDTFNALKKNEIVFLQENKELLSLTCTDAGIFASVEDTLQKTLMMGRFRLFGKISAGNPLTRISLLIHKYHAQKEIMLDNDLFSAMMTTLASRCMVLPKNAYFEPQNDHVNICPEKTGQYLKATATRENIIRALEEHGKKDKPSADRVNVEVVTGGWPPAATAMELDEMGVKEKISSFSTSISPGNANRTHNIMLASSVLDGYILAPQETFSFNEIIGAATRADGYKEAPIISGGKLVPGVGGGLCQVSSTLYNNALLASLKIIERHNHSLPVGYVSLGRDATIAHDYLDLKFENSLDDYLMIDAEVKNNRLVIQFYSRKNEMEVQIISTNKVQIPAPIVMEKDKNMEPGNIKIVQKGTPGYRITTWRLFLQDGSEIGREKLSDDYYKPKPFIYRAAPE